MIVFGIVLTFVFGACIVLSISQKLKLIEALGLSFPLGIAAQTFFMVCLDWANIKITAQSVIITTIVALVALLVYLFFRRRQLAEWLTYICNFTFPKIHWAWLLCIVAIVALTVMNVAKAMYFPTFDTDSIRGFDLMGIAVANEGTIKHLSIFVDVNYTAIQTAPGSYMTYVPLTQLSYAYVYMLGAETSKLINALQFISFALSFYGLVSRFATHLLTAIVTFFMLLTPEMLGFSSMSGTNFIHGIYASLGIIYFAAWYYKKVPSFLWLSAALLMCNFWTRNEGIAFIGAACCILLWLCWKNKKDAKLWKRPILFGLLGVFPFVFYNIFLKINHLESTNVFITKPFWDGEKASYIVKEAWLLFKSTSFYGITFVLFLYVLISNIFWIYKKQDQAVTLFLIVAALLFYTLLVYQINYLWDTIDAIMHYSYKRFLFSFVPLLWFYIAANWNMNWLFGKIDKFMFPVKTQK